MDIHGYPCQTVTYSLNDSHPIETGIIDMQLKSIQNTGQKNYLPIAALVLNYLIYLKIYKYHIAQKIYKPHEIHFISIALDQ